MFVCGPATLFAVDRLRAIGGPDAGAGSAWRWDLVLRLIERFGHASAVHIPFVTIERQ